MNSGKVRPSDELSTTSSGYATSESPAMEERKPGSPLRRVTYKKVLEDLNSNETWQKEITLGRRVGFYRFRADLGSGNFSQVKLALHQLTKERVAVKIIDKTKLDQKTHKMLHREISTMDSLQHPNIIRLFEVVETISKIHLVMEYAGGGELFTKITTEGRMCELDARPIYAQIVSAIEHMHGYQLIHRDIKAENVFYARADVVKVGDFGFSTRILHPAQQLTTFCGSPPYAAPELFKDESYVGTPVDVWALGILLYFMVTGSMPFKAQTVASLKKLILEGEYAIPQHVSGFAKECILGLLQPSPAERLTIEQLKRSSWLDDQFFPVAKEDYFQCAPKVDVAVEDLGEPQKEVLPQLELLGIDRNLLSEHVERGYRSSVIGTYRILINRFETNRDHPTNASAEQSLASIRSVQGCACNDKECYHQQARAAAAKRYQGGPNKSKLCSII